MQAVIDETGRFLGSAVTEPAVNAMLDAVRNYFWTSDRFAAQFSMAAADQDDADGIPPTGARATLFWAAVSDMLVFRCIGLADCWAALNQIGVTATDDPARFGQALGADLELAMDSGAFIERALRPVAGGAADDLERLARRTVDNIATASTTHVLGSTLDVLGDLVPAGTATKAARALRHVGRALGLDKLLDWAQRILELALIKMRRVFGPGFDVIIEPLKAFLDKVAEARGHLADMMFRVPQLWDECKTAVEIIEASAAPERIDKCRDDLIELADRFDYWDRGLDIADISLKWGWRISTVSPPVAITLTTVRAALAAGAFLIGRYHLDSPELGFIHWDTRGVLSVLHDYTPGYPGSAGPPRTVIKGDDGF